MEEIGCLTILNFLRTCQDHMANMKPSGLPRVEDQGCMRELIRTSSPGYANEHIRESRIQYYQANEAAQKECPNRKGGVP
jgi:hypothetical protein